jgi:hypothetical protein
LAPGAAEPALELDVEPGWVAPVEAVGVTPDEADGFAAGSPPQPAATARRAIKTRANAARVNGPMDGS